MAVSAFNLGGGVKKATLENKVFDGNTNIKMSFSKCSVLVVSLSTTWSDNWVSSYKGVVSGQAETVNYALSNYSSMNHTTYLYKNVAEGTVIDFGTCVWRVNAHIVSVK